MRRRRRERGRFCLRRENDDPEECPRCNTGQGLRSSLLSPSLLFFFTLFSLFFSCLKDDVLLSVSVQVLHLYASVSCRVSLLQSWPRSDFPRLMAPPTPPRPPSDTLNRPLLPSFLFSHVRASFLGISYDTSSCIMAGGELLELLRP